MDKKKSEELEKEKNINKRIREELAMNYNIKIGYILLKD